MSHDLHVHHNLKPIHQGSFLTNLTLNEISWSELMRRLFSLHHKKEASASSPSATQKRSRSKCLKIDPLPSVDAIPISKESPAKILPTEPISINSVSRASTLRTPQSWASTISVNTEIFRYGDPVAASMENESETPENANGQNKENADSTEKANENQTDCQKDFGANQDEIPKEPIPSFIKDLRVLYSGFGGWILLKRLRNHPQRIFAVVKTFKCEEGCGDESYTEICHNEYNLMNRLRNRHVVPVYNLCKDEDPSGKYYWSLAMPFYHYGDLFSILVLFKKEPIPGKLREALFKQMLESIKFLHSKNVVHCDVKLDNFLVDDQFNVKVTDFGMSVDLDKYEAYTPDERLQFCQSIDPTKIGTKSYRPPELFFPEKKAEIFGKFQKGMVDSAESIQACLDCYDLLFKSKKLDIWALAICYITMTLNLMRPWDFADRMTDENFEKFYTVYKQSDFLSRKLPITNTQEVNKVLENTVGNHSELDFTKRLLFDSKCAILRMLNVESDLRPLVEEVFESDWIKNVGFCSQAEFSEVFKRVFPE